MNHTTQKKLYCIDLFAGCGGLSLGLERAGFQPLFVSELNDDARESYLINREDQYSYLREPRFHCGDVKDLTHSEARQKDLIHAFKTEFDVDIHAGELDLLVGGPPCQGFSGIGIRRSYSVDKKHLPSNHLFQEMAALIAAFQPKIFLFENVRGILTSRWTGDGEKGEIWRDVHACLSTIPGYTLNWSLVFAKDYGVPQNRPRVLAVGVRNDISLNEWEQINSGVAAGFLPAPLKTAAPDLIDLLGDLADPAYLPGQSQTLTYPFTARTEIQRCLRTSRDGKVRKKGERVSEQDYSKHSDKVVSKFSAMHANNGEIPEAFRTKKFAQRLLPPRWDKAGPSITATSLADDYVHYSQPRVLTVREWARLQGFPDWYQFAGSRTTGGLRRAGNPLEGNFDRELPKYTQIGNAVPVWLAEAVGTHFSKILR